MSQYNRNIIYRQQNTFFNIKFQVLVIL